MSITRNAAGRIRDQYEAHDSDALPLIDAADLDDTSTVGTCTEVSADGGSTWERSDADLVHTIAWACTVGRSVERVGPAEYDIGPRRYRLVATEDR